MAIERKQVNLYDISLIATEQRIYVNFGSSELSNNKVAIHCIGNSTDAVVNVNIYGSLKDNEGDEGLVHTISLGAGDLKVVDQIDFAFDFIAVGVERLTATSGTVDVRIGYA